MPAYRISKLSIRGMRSIDDLELDLTNTTVLIGPNGAGKTSIIEACELLRKAASERPFVTRLLEAHGGADALLRKGASELVLGADLVGTDGSKLIYEASFVRQGQWLIVDHEYADIITPTGAHEPLLNRTRSDFELRIESVVVKQQSVGPDDLALSAAAYQLSELEALRSALASIEIHTAFDARALWTTGPAVELGLRATNIIRPALRVEPGGRNLPNVYHALRNQRDWQDTLARVQLALGDRVEDVVIPADLSGGRISLALRLKDIGEITSYAMSDGQLAYLALLGVLRLQRPFPPSLVAFDEPDLHLHPGLVRRLMSDLEVFGRTTTTIVATHSDAMLDALSEPARSAVLCELDEHAATRCLRPDADELARWLQNYRGLGELRSEGYEKVVFPLEHVMLTSRIRILYEDSRGPTNNFGLHKLVLAAVQDVLHEQGNDSLQPFELVRRIQAIPKNSDGKVLTALADDSDLLHGGHSVVIAWLDDDKLHRALGQRTKRNIVASSSNREKIDAVRSFAPKDVEQRPGALKVFLVKGNTEQLLDRINAARPNMFTAEQLQAAQDKDLTARDLCFTYAARPGHADWRAEVRRRDVPFDCMVRFMAQVAVHEPWPPWRAG